MWRDTQLWVCQRKSAICLTWENAISDWNGSINFRFWFEFFFLQHKLVHWTCNKMSFMQLIIINMLFYISWVKIPVSWDAVSAIIASQCTTNIVRSPCISSFSLRGINMMCFFAILICNYLIWLWAILNWTFSNDLHSIRFD